MAKTKQQPLDFRFYDMPQRDPVLAFGGEAWRRVYGKGAPNLHFHNVMEVGVCLEGSGKMIYEEEEIPYHAGMVSVIPQNVPHNTVNEPGAYSLWSYVFIDSHSYLLREFSDDPQFLAKTENRIGVRYFLEEADQCPEIVSAAEGILREREKNEPYAREMINAYVMQILMATARNNRAYDQANPDEEHRHSKQQIRGVLDFIQKHFSEPLTIGDLAGSFHVSETHFRRIFKECMNMSPADYLNMIRIQQACTMLLKTDFPVDLVAEKAGFTTLSTFNRNFRHFMDDSPLRWKKRHVNTEHTSGLRVQALRGWTDDVL